jgi:hypothetical protein
MYETVVNALCGLYVRAPRDSDRNFLSAPIRVVIERKNLRGKWFDLTTGIEDGERLGSNCLNVDQRVHIIVGN